MELQGKKKRGKYYTATAQVCFKVFNLIKPFLDPDTKRKITFVDRKEGQANPLSQWIDPKLLETATHLSSHPFHFDVEAYLTPSQSHPPLPNLNVSPQVA